MNILSIFLLLQLTTILAYNSYLSVETWSCIANEFARERCYTTLILNTGNITITEQHLVLPTELQTEAVTVITGNVAKSKALFDFNTVGGSLVILNGELLITVRSSHIKKDKPCETYPISHVYLLKSNLIDKRITSNIVIQPYIALCLTGQGEFQWNSTRLAVWFTT